MKKFLFFRSIFFPIKFKQNALLIFVLFYSGMSCFSQELKYIQEDFLKPDSRTGSYRNFGRSMAYHDNKLVVGAPGEFNLSGSSGGIYIFEREETAWIKKEKLFGPDTQSKDYFGHSVAIKENIIVVGAYRFNENGVESAGAVFVFENMNGTWTQVAKLIPSDSGSSDFFGSSVALDGNFIIVGSPGHDGEFQNAGAVYIFQKLNGVWQETQKLNAPQNNISDGFGTSLSIENEFLVISEHEKIYVYENLANSWSFQSELVYNQNSLHRTGFEPVVDISNKRIAVGGVHSVIIFDKTGDNWNEIQELRTTDPISNYNSGNFGKSFDLEGDRILIGALNHSSNGLHSGKAYYLEKEGNLWSEKKRLISSNIGAGDNFGISVALTPSTLLVGAEGEDSLGEHVPEVDDPSTAANHSGAVYSFMIDTDGDGVVDEVEIADGTNLNDNCDFVWENQNAVPNEEWMTLDCDEDGLSNLIEYETESYNPVNSDSDNDGIDDALEKLENPFLEIASRVDICPTNGENLVRFHMSGTSDFKLVTLNENPNINGVTWQILDENSCAATDESCANDMMACNWYYVSSSPTNLSYNITQKKEFRVNIEYNDGTIDVFYAKHTDQIQVTPVEVSIAQTSDNTCYGANDASLEVVASGGTGVYTYELFDSNNGALLVSGAANIFQNLPPGSYYVIVSDADANQAQSNQIIISEPEPLDATITVNYINCYESNNGSATIEALGGIPPYKFSIDGISYGQQNTFENLAPGTYSGSVRDSYGCTNYLVFDISQGQPITPEFTVSKASCENANGSITVVIDNPGEYLYSIGENFDVSNLSLESTFSGLNAGTYSIWVAHANGCTLQSIVTIESEDCLDFTLPVDNFIIEATGESCASSNNGNILLRAEENLDYTATLVGGAVNESKEFRTFTNFADLEAGSYELCITVADEPDYQRCFNIQISEPDGLEVDSKIDDSGKTVSLSLKGSTKYFINVNGTEYSTSEGEITLPLSKVENSISVKTDKECQGVYEEMLLATYDSISIFPNPVENGDVSILLPSNNIDKEVLVTLFSQNGTRVLEKMEEPEGRTVNINMDGLLPGIYTIIITTESQNSMRKIIKK
ncbi:T9SS type A sorting domain-containing protein [Maribacter sp. 2308TA10-17]|uniref:T9SS type A sorting domain-containing protein n=1 Tax=Maribacter sp. 2308TA10-17 TaxID=3386276 RepID=UPI0039BC4F52